MSAVVAGVLGVGTTASAVGLFPGWGTLTTSVGSSCELQIIAELPNGDGEPITDTFSCAEQKATSAASQEFLESFDFDSIDRRAAIARWQAIEEQVGGQEEDPGEQQPSLEGDDLEVQAVTSAAVARLKRYPQMRPLTPETRVELRTAMCDVSRDLLGYFERRTRSRDDAADLRGECSTRDGELMGSYR